MSDASVPSWDRVSASSRRAVDLKLVIAVLIGIVSVTGATIAWRSALAGEKATDADRQTIAEVVLSEQSRANIEVIVQDARARFADHAIGVVEARLLDEQAQRAADDGDAERAAALASEAVELRALARRTLEGSQAPVLLSAYVTEGDGGRPVFDEGQLAEDLAAGAARDNQVNPAQTRGEAGRLRAESEHYDRWLIGVVAAVVLLTMAQVVALRPARLGFAALGVALWIVSSVTAFWGG
jgi:hypothetical protein